MFVYILSSQQHELCRVTCDSFCYLNHCSTIWSNLFSVNGTVRPGKDVSSYTLFFFWTQLLFCVTYCTGGAGDLWMKVSGWRLFYLSFNHRAGLDEVRLKALLRVNEENWHIDVFYEVWCDQNVRFSDIVRWYTPFMYLLGIIMSRKNTIMSVDLPSVAG